MALKAKERERDEPVQVTELPKKPLGRPLLIGAIDEDVQRYIRQIRLCGGVINTAVVTAVAKAFVFQKSNSSLMEYGGHIQVTSKRMNFVKRRGSTAAKITPAEFEIVKESFLGDVRKKVSDGNIPNSFIFNWDQTGLQLFPTSEWTMELSGSQRVSIAGSENKKEITALICVSTTGTVLPAQLLYEGKTDRCHPNFNFPAEWDVWHSSNHWSNGQTVLRYLDEVFLPHVEAQRQEIGFPPTQKALLLLDVFRAHRMPSVLSKLEQANIDCLFIVPNCTDQLQPLDVAVNKAYMKSRFIDWYSEKVQEQLSRGTAIENVKVIMSLSVMKGVTCNWIVGMIDHIKSKPDIIINGFKQPGILDAIHSPD